MKALTTATFHQFLELPLELQMAVIRQVNSDRVLFRLFSANRHTWSLFKEKANLIFGLSTSPLTDQPLTSLLFHRAKIYLSRQKKAMFYIKKQEENHTALSFMVFNGFEKTARLYIESMQDRAEMLHKARNGYNLLMLAILSGSLAMVELILEQPEAPQLIGEGNAYGDKVIHIAARVGDRDILECLVKDPGFPREFINANGNYRYSPVVNFCKYGLNDDPDFLEALVESGAWIDSRASCYDGSVANSVLNDPIFSAIKEQKPKVALRLLSALEKEDFKKHVKSPKLFLEDAIKLGYKDIAKFLIECDVGVDPKRDPGSSLLVSTLRFHDAELMALAFQLESQFYKRVLVETYQSVGVEYRLPVFADYLLGAINQLMGHPASKETVDTYHALMAFGFDTAMVFYTNGLNVFHLISINFLNFIGETEESIFCAEKIIFDLLTRDSDNLARNKAADDGICPIRSLPGSEHRSSETTFEEGISALFAEARQFLANEAPQSSEMVAFDDRGDVEFEENDKFLEFAHDKPDRCSIM